MWLPPLPVSRALTVSRVALFDERFARVPI